jgi:hypothetical protein
MSANAQTVGLVNYAAISEIWSKVLLKQLYLTGIAKRLGVDHSKEIAANSDTIHMRLVGQVVSGTYNLNDSADIVYTTPTVSDVVLSLTDNKYCALAISKAALKNADVDFKAATIDNARYEISKQIDTFIMNTIIAAVPAANTLTAYDATAGAEGDMYDQLLQLGAILKKNGAVPLSNTNDLFVGNQLQMTPYVVVNPDVMRFILKEPAFVKIDSPAQKPGMWNDGIVQGKIAGLVIYESSNLPTTTGTVNVFAGVQGATHYAIKKIEDEMMPSQNKFQVLWRTLFQYGCKVSQPNALAKVVVTVVASDD